MQYHPLGHATKHKKNDTTKKASQPACFVVSLEVAACDSISRSKDKSPQKLTATELPAMARGGAAMATARRKDYQGDYYYCR